MPAWASAWQGSPAACWPSLIFLVGAFFPRCAAPCRREGHVEVRGLKAPVEILRDKNAVPHIIAGSIEDAVFGWAMLTPRIVSGRWS